ncbi:MAG: NAD(P)-dependent oxidoreductase [Nitrospirae bacterium]|nr:MAG: NAD(P)-dependent oxidoreductase [Nitrospirota bacterium]
MPEIVVTGAAGFIGRAVCAELLRRGATVQAVGRSKPVRLPGIAYQQVGGYDQLKAPAGSICLHLAGRNSASGVTGGSEADHAAAMDLTRALLSRGFSRVIFASSALVYGDQCAFARQEDEPATPAGVYARSKAAVEAVLLAHGHCVARIANVYGAGMAETNVLSDLLSQIPGSGMLRVRNLTPVRDFIHVTDVARGLADLAMEGATGIFNLGTGKRTSIQELASLLAAIAGESDRRPVSEAAQGRLSVLILDPDKMRRRFGWQAEVQLHEGLRELVERRLNPVSQ